MDKTENNQEMVSLYEFLGHAAGPKLGKQVATAATQHNIPIDSHEIHTPTYSGTILKYPKSFLIKYFNKNTTSLS